MDDEPRDLVALLDRDVIRLIALSADGVVAIRWCSTCKAARTARPPIKKLQLGDDGVNQLLCGEIEAPCLAGLTNFALGGLQMHIRIPEVYLGKANFDGVMGKLWFASEITHLSLAVVHHPSSRERRGSVVTAAETQLSRILGSQFTSLRVLEVLRLSNKLDAQVVASLVQATSATLRSLSILGAVTGTFDNTELRDMFRVLGPRLQYLSVYNVDSSMALFCDGRLKILPRNPSACDLEEEMELEMETEMLQNAAEGLCISLLEPARVRAHEPFGSATAADRIQSCLHILPATHWLACEPTREEMEMVPPRPQGPPLPLLGAQGHPEPLPVAPPAASSSSAGPIELPRSLALLKLIQSGMGRETASAVQPGNGSASDRCSGAPTASPALPTGSLRSLEFLRRIQSGGMQPVQEAADEEAEDEEDVEGADEGGEETDAAEERLQTLYEDTVRRTWDALGRSAPFWGVLTHDEYAGQATLDSAAEAKYIESGAGEVQMMDAALRGQGQVEGGLKALGAAGAFLELGCGTGRIALHMAPLCTRVVCVDIAPSYLEALAAAMAARNISNYDAVLLPQLMIAADDGSPCTSGTWAPPPEGIQFIYSLITLQHNPPSLQLRLIRAICTVLALGGYALLHIPYHVPYHVQRMCDAPVMQMHAVEKAKVAEAIKDCNCTLIVVLDGAKYDHCGPGYENAIYLLQKNKGADPAVDVG